MTDAELRAVNPVTPYPGAFSPMARCSKCKKSETLKQTILIFFWVRKVRKVCVFTFLFFLGWNIVRGMCPFRSAFRKPSVKPLNETPRHWDDFCCAIFRCAQFFLAKSHELSLAKVATKNTYKEPLMAVEESVLWGSKTLVLRISMDFIVLAFSDLHFFVFFSRF